MAIEASHYAVPTETPLEAKDRPTFMPQHYPAFTLMHHPKSWECVQVDGEWTWLPRLKRLKEVPGANGVRGIGKKNTPDSSHARTHFADTGWTLIQHRCIPDGSDLLGDGLTPIAGNSYMVTYQGAFGKFNLLRWDHPKKVAGQWTTRHDDAGYNRFRKMLVEEGFIKPIEDEIKDGIVDRMRARVSRYAKDAHIPTIKGRIDEAEKAAAAMDEAPPVRSPKRAKRGADVRA